jgi:hypothetical protein
MLLRRSAAVSQEALAAALSRAKVHLDGLTGAHELARLAQTVAQRDAEFAAARSSLRCAKEAFETASQSRTTAQQELNALLQARARAQTAFSHARVCRLPSSGADARRPRVRSASPRGRPRT